MLLSGAVRFIFQMACSDKSEKELQLLKPETVIQVHLNLRTMEPHIELCISCSELSVAEPRIVENYGTK
jgi:hypothetical protein